MTFDLHAALPRLVPKAIAWAEAQYASIAQLGQPLDEHQVSLASRVGVVRPDLIRLVGVPRLPLPEDAELRGAAIETGLLSPRMIGMTFSYGVYICHGHATDRLLSHEFRHVQQYEQAGSIAVFLPVYLDQIVTVGYWNAPFEIDARMHESADA